MRSQVKRSAVIAVLSIPLLSGCLVSEEPVLDVINGREQPLKPGAYTSCSYDGDGEPDCITMQISIDPNRAYKVVTEDEETLEWRFRSIGWRAYAMQSAEGDEGYAYYYAKKIEDGVRLVFMQCLSLPEALRARLIKNGDLASEDSDFETCEVLTDRGLVEAAKAYDDGEAVDEEELSIVITAGANLDGALDE